MAGIYIHIPFCRRKCHYCNFYSVATSRYRGEFMDGITEELYLRRKYLGEQELQTIYFGGGTPSYLEVRHIQKIFEETRKYHKVSSTAEITLEANPDDEFAKDVRANLTSEPERYAAYTREYLGWGVFALMPR